MTATETFRLIVSLASVCDGELFEQAAAHYLREIPSSDLKSFRNITMELQRLINEYEYLDSPAFLNSIEGKSKQIIELMRRVARDPVRRKEHQREFVESLRQLPESRTAFTLVAERHHEFLDKALAAVTVASSGIEG